MYKLKDYKNYLRGFMGKILVLITCKAFKVRKFEKRLQIKTFKASTPCVDDDYNNYLDFMFELRSSGLTDDELIMMNYC